MTPLIGALVLLAFGVAALVGGVLVVGAIGVTRPRDAEAESPRRPSESGSPGSWSASHRWLLATPLFYVGSGVIAIVGFGGLNHIGVHLPDILLLPWAPIVGFINSFELLYVFPAYG